MPRRDHLQGSLFPFMSILACTIGALMFLLVTLAMTRVQTGGALAAQDAAPPASREEAIRLRAEADRLAGEVELLERARAQAERLDQKLRRLGIDSNRSFTGIQDQLKSLDRGKALAAEFEELERKHAQTKKQRDDIETRIAVLESRRETLPILIDPTGLSPRQAPHFIECDGGGATLIRVEDDFVFFVSKDSLSTNGEFGRYLRRVRALPNALLVLLVREDGIDNSLRVEKLARNAEIRTARLPIPGKGELDFRLLRKAEAAGQ